MSGSDFYEHAKAWPFAEARDLLARLEKKGHDKAVPVVFQTGYGPSGLPHIGTFGEVVRTSMVRHAFEKLTGGDYTTRLICFSDDMDGLRKVPDNIPKQEMIAEHLGKPLTDIPDPFGTHESFGEHNNAKLREFLDGFGFNYEFVSATACYRGGKFDDALMEVLRNYDAIRDVVLPTLGAERKATYSPFLPVSTDTGAVLQVEITGLDVARGTVQYSDPRDGHAREVSIRGGGCKLQWKCDWAMRWAALGVDYEMCGKDLDESRRLSSKIASIMGGVPPAGIIYELFLDEKGEKISKSRGNGLSVEEWLAYGGPESLALFMYNKPKTAKRLFFDVIPKTVDEYFSHLAKYGDSGEGEKTENPVWHIHAGNPPASPGLPVSFSLLVNLASACGAAGSDIIWGFLGDHMEGDAQTHPELARLVDYAVKYYRDYIEANKYYRTPDEKECAELKQLKDTLGAMDGQASAEDIQKSVFAIGKAAGYDNLRDWFGMLYETLLGQKDGPRMGSFIKLYGIDNMTGMIDAALKQAKE